MLKYLDKLVSRFHKRSRQPVIEEPFITLMQVARDSPDIRNTLLAILNKDEFHRTSMINTLMEEMRYKGAPDALLTAIAGLLDRQVAQKAYELLKE